MHGPTADLVKNTDHGHSGHFTARASVTDKERVANSSLSDLLGYPQPPTPSHIPGHPICLGRV